jgi:nitrous oxidase accessory protein NosD
MVIASGSFVFASSAMATTPPTVCGTGCAFTSIQDAINAAAAGDVITVGPGSYMEDLVVNKPVTIDGSGSSTVLYPAVSGPLCSSGGGSICAGGTNMILVQSSDVTVENMRLEGDNPSLTSGVVVGGADIDARNGIIEDWTTYTPYNNTTVTNVTVSDVYLRGIYASSGGANFDIAGNTVDNVQGSPSSIAIFNFSGSGVIADNHVSRANDAISANWSTGTSFLDNVVAGSASGVHTDNSGWNGVSTDLIQGNAISACMTDGYGIFVFAQYNSVAVHDNSVGGCYMGLAVFGSQVPGATTTFSGNNVHGGQATTTDPTGTYGGFVVTDLLGYGAADVNAVFSHNKISGFTTGLFVSETTTFYGDAVGGHATVTAHQNSIVDNLTGAKGDVGTTLTADANYWGCRQGPNTPGKCDSAVGTTSYVPWLTHAPGLGG